MDEPKPSESENGGDIQLMIFDFIEKHYRPCNEKEADTFICTSDLKAKLEAHLGVEIDSQALFTMLEKKGYTYFDLGAMEFVWTLKKVDQPGNEG